MTAQIISFVDARRALARPGTVRSSAALHVAQEATWRQEFGRRLAQVRGALDLSEGEMAAVMGISVARLRRAESGAKVRTLTRSLMRLGQDMGVSMDWLLDGTGTMVRARPRGTAS